jgi:hypothetical protein
MYLIIGQLNRSFSYKLDLLNLAYLNQVVKESLKKRPPFPILSRYLSKNENLETTSGLLNLQTDTVLLYPIALAEDADYPLSIWIR